MLFFGPLLWDVGVNGIWLGVDYSDGAMGIIVEKYLIPVYSVKLVVTTTIVVSFIVLIVSYLPSRRIAKMKPTDALRGKVSV